MTHPRTRLIMLSAAGFIASAVPLLAIALLRWQ